MQSFTVEDRQYRSVRAWPVWSGQRDQYLLTELGHEVNIDQVRFDTAPFKNRVTFSLLGLTMDDQTKEAGLHNPTDTLATVGNVEDLYIKIGQQIYRHRVSLPYRWFKGGNYRILDADYMLSVPITSEERAHDGVILNLLDPYTAAGIRVEVSITIRSQINLELGDTYLVAEVNGTHSVFPAHKSLQDHDLRSSIHLDIERAMASVEVLGYTLDIERKNLLKPELTYPTKSKVHNPEVAAAALAARYGQAS